jgi:hypothetical protein
MADQVIKFNGFPFLEQESKEDEDAFFQPSKSTCRKVHPCCPDTLQLRT